MITQLHTVPLINNFINIWFNRETCLLMVCLKIKRHIVAKLLYLHFQTSVIWSVLGQSSL